MRGIVLGLVGEALGREYGGGPWDPGGRVTAVFGASPDEVDGAAVGRGSGAADAPSDSLVCWLARRVVPLLADKYPSLFRTHAGLRSFLESLSDREVGGGEAGAPAVLARCSPDGELFLSLDAVRAPCALVKGVVAGAAEHYGERVTITELKCGAGGDNRCVIRVGFEEASAPADRRPRQRRARLA